MNYLEPIFDIEDFEQYEPTEIEKRIAELLKQKRGNISRVAAAYPCVRANIYKHINKSAYLQFIRHEVVESRIDNAESKLDEAVDRCEGWAVSLVLRTLGRNRGYVERGELNVNQRTMTVADLVLKVSKEAEKSSQS